MPNLENIKEPITLIGNGRSGTSLVSRILGAHSTCRFVGETANLIHSVVKSMESSLPEKKQREIPELIRYQFLQLFQSNQPRWVHKPIGIPIIHNMFAEEDAFIAWYWDTFEAVFPNAIYLTVLRHPLDVAVSSHRWWGNHFQPILERNRLAAKIATHPKSKLNFAVNYHNLIADPDNEVRRLLDFVGLDFQQQCRDAVEAGHVLSGKSDDRQTIAQVESKNIEPATDHTTNEPEGADTHLQERRSSSFSHRDGWNEIDSQLLTSEYRDAIEACWRKFGFDFGGWNQEPDA